MQLALGTVQFGIAYGIAGRGEPVPEAEVRAILEDAAAQGVTMLDTAAAYGDIEPRLARLAAGLPLRIVSKIPALNESMDPAAAAQAALTAARQSHQRLGPALCGLMMHRAQDLQGARGEAVWGALAPWARNEGIVLGASCYAPAEAASLAAKPGIALCQLPGNALDQRIAQPYRAEALRGVEVHLRSAFLQGLLLMPRSQASSSLPTAAAALARWHAWADKRGLSPLEAALSVVKSFSVVSSVVVGVDSLYQWRAIAVAWRSTRAVAAPELATNKIRIIDPRHWA
jgi:aryl-alcohol dehydrogenase-like predicted oxidoreductase